MKKFIICLLILLLPTIAIGETVDDFLSQDLIEEEKYFEPDARLTFINDILEFYCFDLEFETIDDFKDYAIKNWNYTPYYTPRISVTDQREPSVLLYEATSLSIDYILNLAQEKLVFLFANDNIYMVNPSEEDLYTTTVGEQNWYSLKTKIESLKNLYIAYTDFPAKYTLEKYLKEFTEVSKIGKVDLITTLKALPNVESDDNAVLSVGDIIEVISENDDWYYVKYDLISGFVLKKYITDFSYPLPDWSSRHISSKFAMRIHPVYDVKKMHNGIDIPAAKGTPVFATEDGVVTQARYSDTAGWFVDIQHNGYTTRYCHASKLLVYVGQQVKAGDTIMLVGSTGISTGNHLHFSYIINGEFFNPVDYLDWR